MEVNKERLEKAVNEIKKCVKVSDIFKKLGYFNNTLERSDEIYISCPFHVDETPSLGVNDIKGVWHCFSCGKGGDVIKAYKDLLFKSKGIKINYYTAIDQIIHDLPELKVALSFTSVKSVERDTITENFKINRFNPNTFVCFTMNDVNRYMQKNKIIDFEDIARVVDLMIENTTPESILSILKNSDKGSKEQRFSESTLTVTDLLNSLDW